MSSGVNALLSLNFDWRRPTIQGKYSFECLVDVVLSLFIGCNVLVKIFLANKYRFGRKRPRFPGLKMWLGSIHIYFGTTVDVLISFGSLVRINMSYLYLAIPFIVIFILCVLCMRNNQVSGQEENLDTAGPQNIMMFNPGVEHIHTVVVNPDVCLDVKSGGSRDGTDDGKKKSIARSRKRNNEVTGTSADVKSAGRRVGIIDDDNMKLVTRKNNGKKSTVIPDVVLLLLENNDLKKGVMPEDINSTVVVLLAPHLILSVFGVIGDPDHDGNNYDISNFLLFLTCMLQGLTLIMISRGKTKASYFLYKASLIGLLSTAHILVVNAFGEKVVLLLLPEVVPPLIWVSLHLDRRTPIINVKKIVDREHFVLKALVIVMCGFIMQVVQKDESLLYWAITSCLASGLITYTIVRVLRLWPEKAGFATLSSDEVLVLLTFWWKLLLQVSVVLFLFGGRAYVYTYQYWANVRQV